MWCTCRPDHSAPRLGQHTGACVYNNVDVDDGDDNSDSDDEGYNGVDEGGGDDDANNDNEGDDDDDGNGRCE